MKRKAILLFSFLLVMQILVTPAVAGFGFGFGDVKGRVTDSSGTPLQSVKVTMTYRGRTVDTDYTNRYGNYQVYFTDILSSRISVQLTYRKAGCITKTVGCYLYPGQTTTKNVVLIKPDTTPPAKVTGLAATTLSLTAIRLDWNANSESDMNYYRIYRNGIETASATENYYLDTGLTPDTTYNYQVSAVDTNSNEGQKSIQVSATTEAEPVHWYALIVAGYMEVYNPDTGGPSGVIQERFVRDAWGMYTTLVDHYGMTDSDIHFLMPMVSDGAPAQFPEYISAMGVLDAETTPSNLQAQTDLIASKSTQHDRVLIWWTGHGKSVPYFTCPHAINEVPNMHISPSALDNALDTIICEFMYIMLGPCYSGAWIDPLKENNRVIFTSCASDQKGEVTWAGTHSIWPWGTYQALDSDLNATVADTTHDGRISLGELFDFAKKFLYDLDFGENQTPQRWKGDLIGSYDAHFIGDAYY
jgi:hypothetical protein